MAFSAYDELEELAGLKVKFVLKARRVGPGRGSLLLWGRRGNFVRYSWSISILVTNQSNKQGAVALERGLEKSRPEGHASQDMTQEPPGSAGQTEARPETRTRRQ